MKRINEAKFRSPKWLRNYLDFELNTGDDISGEPSKRKAAKLEKERQEKEKQERLKKEAEAEKERTRQAMHDLWEKEAKRKAEQEQIERELNTLYRSMISDFNTNRYSDKIETPQRNGQTACYYKFENGKVLKIYKNTNDLRFCLEWENIIYTLGVEWSNKFISLCNEMIEKGGSRPKRSGYDRYDSYGRGSSSGSSGYRSSSSQDQRKANTPPKWKDHPKGPMYQNLKDTARLRKEQLAKTAKTDPNYEALKNELEAAEAMIKKMNQKYQFESIKNFTQFNQIFESSKFIDQEEFDSLLDKIGDEGMQSLSDIEKKRLNLFSQDDKPIYDLIDQMADITLRFKDINQRMDDLTDAGKSDEAQKIFKDEWQRANDEIIIIEREIESYGIELGDRTFDMMMKKHRPDAYGYDPNREEGLEEMDI